MMILRGVTLFPYYDLGGGAVENYMSIWGGGGNHFLIQHGQLLCCGLMKIISVL